MYQALCQPLPTAQEKSAWDKTSATYFGIPPYMLMENASRSALECISKHVALTTKSRILIFMGGGNNGGDGACLARHLLDKGCAVLVCHSKPLSQMPEPAKKHCKIAKKTGVNFLHLKDKQLPETYLKKNSNPDIIIDAICGIGVQGSLRQKESEMVDYINNKGKQSFIVALDIPTGLCPQTGNTLPKAVRANLTVAFEAATPGLFAPQAKTFAGIVEVCSIGMPKQIQKMHPASWALLAPEKNTIIPPHAGMHKGQAGKLMVVGGSAGMFGAPLLSAIAGLRAGAGTVHLALPTMLHETSLVWPEIQMLSTGNTSCWQKSHMPKLFKIIENLRPTAMVIGPGLGRTAETLAFVEHLLTTVTACPRVIDADALWLLATSKKLWKILEELNTTDILTPHPGEMAELLPESFFEQKNQKLNNITHTKNIFYKKALAVQENRENALRMLCTKTPACIILKGAGTLIKQQDSAIVLSPFSTACLAVGGSGDVLAGAVASLLGMGKNTLEAACLGVYLHGRAGKILEQKSPNGHLAREIAEHLPQALQELL